MNLQTQHVMGTIVDKLTSILDPISFVRAFWLVGTVDEYSDIDFWIDFDSEYEDNLFESVECDLSSIAVIDFKHKKTALEKDVPHITIDSSLTVHKRIYHLEGTSEHLRITFS